MNRIKWLVFGLILLILPSMVHALSEDIFSHFQPYIIFGEEYNSNIYLTSNRLKKADFITTISPGLRFSTQPRSEVTGEFLPPVLPPSLSPTTKYGVNLDYQLGLVYYGKEEKNNYVGHRGTLNAWYLMNPHFYFQVKDYLIRSDELREVVYAPDALPGEYYLSTIERERVTYLRNVFEPSVEYRFGKEDRISINYRNNIYEIDSRDYEDSQENYINPRLTYWFNIRHGIYLDYGYTLGDFEDSPDLVGHMAMGRYLFRFNPRTSIFGEYTQLWRNFDDPGVDYTVYRPSIGIEHAFSPTLSARVQGGYYMADPRKGSTFDGPFFDVLLTQRGPRTIYSLSLLGGYTEDFYTSENLGFTQYYRALGRITYQLLQRMTVGIFGSYEWAKYLETVIDDKTPKDQIWAVGCNASYKVLRWLNFSLDATRREDLSNIEGRDYSEYRGIFRITATY